MAITVTLILLLLSASVCADAMHRHGREKDSSFDWENHGNGLQNHRRAKRSLIHVTNVAQLQRKWTFATGFDVSATPAVAEGTVYFPGWNGVLYALDERTGELRWKLNMSSPLNGNFSSGSRATPVVWKERLLVGVLGPARIIAINRHTGSLIWISPLLDSTPYSMITMSGTAYDGFFYVGTSSAEEVYTCCAFQGSMVKINIDDGSVVWRTSMLPPNSGYYGAAVWGSSPSIDPDRRLVFIGTGNNYRVPKSVEVCEKERLKNSELSSDTCHDPENHEDSIVALSIDDGSIIWSRNLQAYDAWTAVCQFSPATATNCPSVLGPDYDFGEAPMLLYNGDACNVLAGQKSGFMWALDCDTGSIIWATAAGPGGTFGGASWGSCSDNERVYTAIINNDAKNFTLAPGREVRTSGGWVAMNATTGHVIWTVGEPSGASPYGPVSVSNGVIFGTSYTPSGDIYAFDALSGAILWHAVAGPGVFGGVSISESCIFVGNGYHSFNPVKYNGTAVHAFCLPDD